METRGPRSGTIVAAIAIVVMSLVGATAYYGFERLKAKRAEAEAQSQELAQKVTPGSTNDATIDLVDPDYLLTVKWPGAGFKILNEADARRLGPLAIAGVVGDAGCMMLVGVEHVPGGDIEGVARAFIEGIGAQEKTTVSFEKTSFDGQPAIRYVVEGGVQGLKNRFTTIVVERDGWFFQLLKSRIVDQPPKCDIPIEGTVTFQAGTIKGRVPTIVRRESAHTTYREKDGVFESGAHALRARVPAGTELLLGADVSALNPDAALGVREGSKTVLVSNVLLCGADGEAYARGVLNAESSGKALPDAPTHTLEVGSKPIALFEIQNATPYATLYGAVLVNERLLSIRATYPPALAAPALELVKRTLEGIEPLDEVSAQKISSELAQRENTRLVRLGRSLRGGKYVDFDHGVRVAFPEEPMLPLLEIADGLVTSSPLQLLRPSTGLTSVLTVDVAGTNTADEQAALAAKLLGVTAADLTVESAAAIPGATHGRFGYDLLVGPKGLVDVVTSTNGKHATHLSTWGIRTCVERAAAKTTKLAEAITHEPAPIPEEESGIGRIKNERFGFELTLPGNGWKRTPMTLPASLASLAVGYELTLNGDSAGVMALHIDAQDPEFLIGLLEQTFAAKLAKKNEPVTRTDKRLGQIMGRHLRWSDKLSAIVAHEGNTYFVAFAELTPNSTLNADAVFAGFSLLP